MARIAFSTDQPSLCSTCLYPSISIWAIQGQSFVGWISLILNYFAAYQRLYDLSRWQTLIQSFRVAIYNLSTLPTEPLLHLAMYAGLASLKLPACYDAKTNNVDCPTCDADLGQLAKEVPFSHHVNSTIVCRITGRIMDSDNFPMAFPNGNVYSREVSYALTSSVLPSGLPCRWSDKCNLLLQALEDMAAKNDGMVTCPRSGEMCRFTDLRKVYISWSLLSMDGYVVFLGNVDLYFWMYSSMEL